MLPAVLYWSRAIWHQVFSSPHKKQHSPAPSSQIRFQSGKHGKTCPKLSLQTFAQKFRSKLSLKTFLAPKPLTISPRTHICVFPHTHMCVTPHTHMCVFPAHTCVFPAHNCVIPAHNRVFPTHTCVFPAHTCVFPAHTCVSPGTHRCVPRTHMCVRGTHMCVRGTQEFCDSNLIF